MDKFEQLQNLINSQEADKQKFYTQGNKAAGRRLRKTLLEIKTLAHDLRKEIISKAD